jgi:hypothetical protein
MTPFCTFVHHFTHHCTHRCRISIFKQLDETGGFFSGVFQEVQLSWRASDYQFFHLTSLQMKVPVCFRSSTQSYTRITFSIVRDSGEHKIGGFAVQQRKSIRELFQDRGEQFEKLRLLGGNNGK